MKHFNYENPERKKDIFYKEPVSFTKYTNKETLAYALGATLYMPAMKESIAIDLINKKYGELTSTVLDLEDSVGDCQLVKAEQMLYRHIEAIYMAVENQKITLDELPLIFIRVRNSKQMRDITDKLGQLQRVITGYVFPKFTYETGKEFLEILRANNTDDIILYGMPILESSEIMYKESRMKALLKIKSLLDNYNEYILNVRIGATDFSGLFGIRRKIDTTIYDVSVIRDCVTDIINVFNRQEREYIISGPVWEYFSKDQRIFKPQLRITPFQDRYGDSGLKKRAEIINEYIDGLINEVIVDKLNGLNGKTIIHPTHLIPVNSLYVVTHEEYIDALSIITNKKGQIGVVKSKYNNKMNEMKPHYHWAKRILLRAEVFGVYNEGQDFTSLIMNGKTEVPMG